MMAGYVVRTGCEGFAVGDLLSPDFADAGEPMFELVTAPDPYDFGVEVAGEEGAAGVARLLVDHEGRPAGEYVPLGFFPSFGWRVHQ